MSDQDFYIKVEPGSIISAEGNMDLQRRIKADIRDQIGTAIENLESVPKSGDAEKFGGKSPDEYAEEIVKRVLYELPKRTGYMVLFKDLKVNEESVVEHKLGACPLTDIYQLDYFRVVASEDDHIFEAFTTFYLYQSDESKIRFRPEESPTASSVSVEIDPSDGHAYRISFETMLKLYKVDYTDDSSLGDVENDFWQAFFSEPNDQFDDNQYYHSPWFDRCCREGRTVKYLKNRKEWDDIYFQMRPRKTINYSPVIPAVDPPNTDLPVLKTPAPTKIHVVHFDFYTLGLTLAETPTLLSHLTSPVPSNPGSPGPDPIKDDHLKVMVLLKV